MHFGFIFVGGDHRLDASGRGSDYTKNIYSSGTEAAENMYAQYA